MISNEVPSHLTVARDPRAESLYGFGVSAPKKPVTRREIKRHREAIDKRFGTKRPLDQKFYLRNPANFGRRRISVNRDLPGAQARHATPGPNGENIQRCGSRESMSSMPNIGQMPTSQRQSHI